MNSKFKLIAGILSVLLVASTFGVMGAIGQNETNTTTNTTTVVATPANPLYYLSKYPGYLTLNNLFSGTIVIGNKAATSDVVGALDLATQYPVLNVKSSILNIPGFTPVSGVDKNNIALDASLGTSFPGNGVLQNVHYNGLKDSTITWMGNSYDYHEQADVSAVSMSNDLSTSNVNGTETMIVPQSGVRYEYVFDQQLPLSTATTAGNTGTISTGTISNPEYNNPINIQLLGKPFVIVGVGSNSVKMLVGSVGTATKTNAVKFGTYSVYSDLGSDGAWARIVIQDSTGSVVDTFILNKANSKDSTVAGLTVKLTDVQALQDGTIVGAEVVVGPTGQVEKSYTTSCDVTSTGSSDTRFPGETNWCIQVKPGTFGVSGTVSAGDAIQVVYKSSSGGTQYFKGTNSTVNLPNSYASLGFLGFNTQKFATITMTPVQGQSVFVSNNGLQLYPSDTLNGVQISSDTTGSIIDSTGTGHGKAYVLYDGSNGHIITAYYDSVSGRAIMAEDSPSATSYPFLLNYGNVGDYGSIGPFVLTASFALGSSNPLQGFTVTNSMSSGLQMDYTTKNGWTNTEVQLGVTAGSAESNDVLATTNGVTGSAGTTSQSVVTDAGVILVNQDSNGGSDNVVFQVPAQTLYAEDYFGSLGTTSAGQNLTTQTIIPITGHVSALDNEVSESGAGNLIIVGGPCANTVFQDLVNAGKIPSTFTCRDASGVLGSSWTPGVSYIITVPDAFKTGQTAVLFAGYEAAETRVSTSIGQLFSTKLNSINEYSVKITGTDPSTATITII